MSDKEGSGSDGSLEEEAYEVEEIREKMRGDDGEWLYYVKASWLSTNCQLIIINYCAVGRLGV